MNAEIIAILTVGVALAGTSRTYKLAPKALKKAGEQPGMFVDGSLRQTRLDATDVR